MDLPRNKFKAALKDHRPQLGLWCAMANAYAAEIVAGSGYDWLLFDTEHSPSEVETVLTQLQSAASYDVSCLVRPATNDTVLIKRYLDIGVQTLLIPYVQSGEEARQAVAAMRYPPEGVRGVSVLTRATGFGRIANYAARAAQELCLLVQIETKAGLDALEEIAMVDGVDGVFIGPADLAASLGHLGEPGHPAVKAAIVDAVWRLKACGKPAGILTPDAAFAKELMTQGVCFAGLGIDAALLARSSENLLAQFRDKA